MKKSLSTAMACIIAASPLAASQQPELSADSISSINLSEVTVVGLRADDSTPVAFTNVTASQLAPINQGADIPFLLSMTPSVITTSDAGAGIGYTSLRIRGTEGSRINVTANGIPINDSESHNVYWVNLPDFASTVKDIQVQRGVGTSTNGAGAFGASVNMATESPSRNAFASLSGSYGMYNTHKETFKVGTGLIADHWAGELRLSNIGTDGYIDRASVKLWSYFGQIGYYNSSSSVRFLAFGGRERTYQAWDYATKEEMEEYGRRYNPCGQYVAADGSVAYYPNQYDIYSQYHFHLLAHHSFTSNLSLDAALHYTKGDGYYEQYKPNRRLVEYGLSPFVTVDYDSDGNVVTNTVKKTDLIRLKKMDNGFGGGLFNITYRSTRVNATLGGALNTYTGHHFGQIAWIRNYVGSLDPLQEYYRNKGRKTDGNVYTRATVDLTHGLSASADLQFRYIHYTIYGVSDTYNYSLGALSPLAIHHDYRFFNPKVGINYRPDNRQRIFASWSVAHKEPTRDNFVDADPGREPSAERLFDYELGYRFTDKIFNAEVNLYYMDYHDQLIATGQLSDTGNSIQVNVPRSYRAGIEMQFGLRPVDWFEWGINATLSRNRIKNYVEYLYEWGEAGTEPLVIDHGESVIAFSPDFTLKNSFTFRYGNFDATVRSQYVGRQYLTNIDDREMSIDPYFVTDLMLGYNCRAFGFKNMRIGFTVNNIFSEKYFNNGYTYAGYEIVDGHKEIYRGAGFAASSPINVIGSVTIDF